MISRALCLVIALLAFFPAVDANAQWQGLCAGHWVPYGAGMRCVCPDGSDGYYSNGRHTCASQAQPSRRPDGCAPGYYRDGRTCVPIGSRLCPGTNGKISCPAGTECSGSRCIPAGSVDCGDGTVCRKGTVCWTNPPDVPGLTPGKSHCPTSAEAARLRDKVDAHRANQRAERERREAETKARKETESREQEYQRKLASAKAERAKANEEANRLFEKKENRSYSEMIAQKKAAMAQREDVERKRMPNVPPTGGRFTEVDQLRYSKLFGTKLAEPRRVRSPNANAAPQLPRAAPPGPPPKPGFGSSTQTPCAEFGGFAAKGYCSGPMPKARVPSITPPSNFGTYPQPRARAPASEDWPQPKPFCIAGRLCAPTATPPPDLVRPIERSANTPRDLK